MRALLVRKHRAFYDILLQRWSRLSCPEAWLRVHLWSCRRAFARSLL